jgi:hypothetical protein
MSRARILHVQYSVLDTSKTSMCNARLGLFILVLEVVNIAALLLGRKEMPSNDIGVVAHIILGGILALPKRARIRVFGIIIIYHRRRSNRSGSGRKDVVCRLVNAA